MTFTLIMNWSVHELLKFPKSWLLTYTKYLSRGSNGPRSDKTGIQEFENNKSADQTAHPRRLISVLVTRLLESIIYKLASSAISIF